MPYSRLFDLSRMKTVTVTCCFLAMLLYFIVVVLSFVYAKVERLKRAYFLGDCSAVTLRGRFVCQQMAAHGRFPAIALHGGASRAFSAFAIRRMSVVRDGACALL